MTKRKITKKHRQAFAEIGRIGGLSSFKKRGKKGMSELGKKAAAVRWGTKKTK